MNLDYLKKDCIYHIYNRGINSCDIFKNAQNYDYFLRLFLKFLNPHITVLSYCLLKNHFHFAVKINEEGKLVTQKLSNFFNAYSKAFNNAHNRTGSLFEKHFKRIELQSEDYLKNLIIYIHTNPQKHQIISNFEDYEHSSYKEIIQGKSIIINNNEVLKLFDNIENFKYVHKFKSVILTEKYSIE